MCRGNQYRNIFETDKDSDLFVRTLGEVCERNGIVVHAWCLMSNHYHLQIETPKGNLVDAMKWFQATFTQRYNSRHKLWGHLFQGRYKAKIIDDSDPSYFRTVSEYINLNPLNDKRVKEGGLEAYNWSSYPFYLLPPSKRPNWLSTEKVLSACGIAGDSAKSRRAYSEYMNELLVAHLKMNDKDKKNWNRMERGWVHGSAEFRDDMIERLDKSGKKSFKNLTDVYQKRDLGESAASLVIEKCLQYFGLSENDLSTLSKSDPRKMMIAGLIRYHYPVSVFWVSNKLAMGHFTTVSRAMHFYDRTEGAWEKKKQCILKFIG
jgi:REP element-mobilizing transposase RayT